MLRVQVNNEVSILSGGEHAGCCLGHLMICYWEKLAERAAKHLHRGQAEHSQHFSIKGLPTDTLLSAHAVMSGADPMQLRSEDAW